MLFGRVGVLEVVLLLALALLIFGPGRLSKLGADLGKGIRGFQEGLKGKEEQEETEGQTSSDTKE